MIQMDALVSAYRNIGDARAAKRHAWEAEDAQLEAGQKLLKAHMLDLLNQTGSKSIATTAGTVFRTEKLKASAADWTAIYSWIVADPDRFELLEKRLKPTFVKQYMEETSGAIPPGVSVHREFEVSVRRPSASGK